MSLIGRIYQAFIKTSPSPTKHGLEAELRTRLSVARMYVRSTELAQKQPDLFTDVRKYVMFLGHARSGGSLAGALLDAHPNVIIADEVDVFQYVNAGFEREQIFHILLERSQRHAKIGHVKAGRDQKQYSYNVPGAWQGRYEQLLVIGHRKAGISTQRLGSDPHALENLQSMLGDIHLKIILSIRNPYDTISTMSIRSGRDLESGVKQYFANCATIRRLKDNVGPVNLLALRHEALLHDPGRHLRAMCQFLDLPAPESYLRACATILFQSPSASRKKVTWSPELIQKVHAQIEQYPFLEGYSYES